MFSASISVECAGSPPVRARFWSNSLKPLVSERSKQIVMVGMRFGILTFQNVCQAVAPSTFAASR